MRNRRLELGLSLTLAAANLDISPQYLSSLELLKNEPAVWDLLVKMAAMYHCTTDFLLGIGQTPDGSLHGEAAELVRLVSQMGTHRQKELLAIARVLYAIDQQTLAAEKDPESDADLTELTS